MVLSLHGFSGISAGWCLPIFHQHFERRETIPISICVISAGFVYSTSPHLIMRSPPVQVFCYCFPFFVIVDLWWVWNGFIFGHRIDVMVPSCPLSPVFPNTCSFSSVLQSFGCCNDIFERPPFSQRWKLRSRQLLYTESQIYYNGPAVWRVWLVDSWMVKHENVLLYALVSFLKFQKPCSN